ncbi:MAG TPA: DUF3445 domain-containing protein [Oceanospirillaceae bacterium]|nr:DUF3445 domain-containing protein [Oceanospirillaceae bacterium]
MPKYLPHMQYKDAISMGLAPLDSQHWIESDQDYSRYLNHKLALRQQGQRHIFDALLSSYEAQVELASALRRHLLPDGIELPSSPKQPLWNASLWVADDVLIMQKLNDEHCLTAASLCSPSSWHLAEKIGQPMARIHDPVPTLHEKLTPKIDRFFDHLTVENPIQRFNWSLQGNNELGQFPGNKQIYPANTPLYYRCERQTLTRLPQTNAIAFTIRVYIYPMMALAQVPHALTQLKAAIDAMPASVRGYKDIIYFAPALQKYFSDLSSIKS